MSSTGTAGGSATTDDRMDHQRGMKGMCSHCGMMMGKSVTATSDGGVIVSVGNKLMKYDKNLKLVKEAEIKVNMAEMQKKMMEQCPKCKEMMQKDDRGK